MPEVAAKINDHIFLTGGGEMGNLVRAFNWADTALGEPGQWPVILKNFTTLVLASPSPMLICWGKEYIQLYNDAYRPILGANKHPQALGIGVAGTYAEIWETIGPMFTRVMAGETVSNPELKLSIERNGYPEDLYFNFSYNPIRDENGHIGGILVLCLEITGQVKANKELDETQRNLHNLLNILTESDFKFRTLIKEAPVAIALINGPELIIEAANDDILQMWGKHERIIGSGLEHALPELDGQPFAALMRSSLETGEIYYGNEHKAFLVHNGVLTEGYYNFIFQPIKDELGKITRLMVIASNVTGQVHSRRELEAAYERERLAKEAAQLGTFDFDLLTNTLECDARCRALSGISHNDQISYENDFLQALHPDDRERVIKAIAGVLDKAATNGDYDIEYRTIGIEDQKLRWIKARGKAYFDKEDKPVRFIGSILDITEQKQDELRKNDFIGMVSHELKTPLTTVKGYIQLLSGKTKKEGNDFQVTALEKVGQKVKTMENMINGFLNIARLESGKLAFIKQEFDLQLLLKEIIEETKLTVAGQEIVFVECSPVNVYADRDKICSVITNFISNAVKYSAKDKIIEVSCKTGKDEVEVTVKDEGMGIPAKDLAHVFDRYYRVEDKNTAHISGFGIGLYLSSEIVQQHQGRIWVNSSPGIGSAFSFSLPIGIDGSKSA